ncbi:MAG TPA: BTAD domain-containing putative transcriptional regulator [Chloroflexaceae bacterium]|nr:BTAD domain-containing putative transcriptional regulator [Chloroflexaceae bacterium]
MARPLREPPEGPAAPELLRQAEQLALDGRLAEARELLVRAWMRGPGADQASRVAWELALLAARLGRLEEAAGWFGRVAAPPPRPSPLWPEARQALVELCRRAATPAGGPGAQPEPLPPLRVINLGRFQVLRGDQALPACKLHNGAAVFRYLLSRRHWTAHREELMELFWPDVAPRRAAHSLHVAVSALRAFLNRDDGNYVLYEGRHYLINPAAAVADDSSAFEQLCDEGDLARQAGAVEAARRAYASATSAYVGDYAADDRDLPWVTARREGLLARYLDALDHLGQILAAEGALDAALDCYRRLLDRDEYREDAHYKLISCYLRLGRRAEARRQYERCVAILAADLGLEPGPEMRELYSASFRERTA